jgi:hypothetical protein
MLRRFFRSQFFAKVFYELLPATIASAIGAYFINSYIRPHPQPAVVTEASADLVQLMRDQQTLLSDYLKKSAEARQRADLAMAQEAERLKTAERQAMQALHEAKAAEMRALAAAARAIETPERRLAKSLATTPAVASAPQPDRAQIDKTPPDKTTVSEPMQLHQAASTPPLQPQTQPSPQPAPATATAAPSRDNGALATLHDAVSGIVRMPSRVSDWFSDAAAPPRPPTDLPQRNFMKALMP